jgi:hypothetical protein
MAWNATWKDWDGSTPAPLWRDQSNPSLPNTNPLTQPWITSVTPDLLTGNPPATPVPQYYGDPLSPYPWFAWNNRPYNNVYELMLVPSDDPGRMLKNYSISITPKLYEPASESEPPFPSLLDFFVSKSFDPAYLNNPPSLYRIFDYLQVPSSFVAEETQARPDNAGVWGNPGDHNFHPPFHKISNYRDTGKINLNTIYDSQVFDGLMNSFPGGWTNDFIRSRKGFGNQTDILEKDPVVPTEFARPFRSSGNAQLTPITPDLAGTDTSAYDREISATILRARPNSGNPRVTDNENLIFQFPSGIPWCNDAQNAYFKYLGVERLGNLTTTRSNVYALWVTVGYFEVKPAPRAVNMPDADHPWMIPAQLNMTVDQLQLLIDQIYPDKYELGQELGSDTGEIVRHRGFYLIDRSIPVGFQRGQDLNVEKSILLKRFIE